MSDLDLLAAEIRRQRQQIDEFLENTANRPGEAAELVEKIERLRRRAAELQGKSRKSEEEKNSNG